TAGGCPETGTPLPRRQQHPPCMWRSARYGAADPGSDRRSRTSKNLSGMGIWRAGTTRKYNGRPSCGATRRGRAPPGRRPEDDAALTVGEGDRILARAATSGGATACRGQEAVKKERAMSMMSEFREFAMRGNVVDLAVGVIIGAAFGRIVDSLVKDLVMPTVGAIFGGLDFSNYFIVLT